MNKNNYPFADQIEECQCSQETASSCSLILDETDEACGEGISAQISPAAKHAQKQAGLTERSVLPADFRDRILDALPGQIAVLDGNGTIIRVNQSWRDFGQANGLQLNEATVGTNYLTFCQRAGQTPGMISARQTSEGIKQLLRGGAESFELEYPGQSGGRQRWFRLLASPLLLDDGSRGAVVMHTNITTRKIAEEKLRESEENMAMAQRIGHFGSWEMDLTQGRKMLHWSDEMLRIFGFEPGSVEVTRDLFFKFTKKEDHAMVQAAMQEAIDSGDTYGVNHRICRADGRERVLHERGRVFRGPDGKATKIIGTAHDVTEQHWAAAALKASEERFQLAVSGAAAGIWDWQLLTNEIYRSPRYCEILGFESAELPATFAAAIQTIYPEDTDRIQTALESHLKHRAPFNIDVRVRTKSGEYKWINARGQALWDENGVAYRMAGSITDITSAKEGENALRQHKELLETVLKHVPAMISLLRNGKVVWVNQHWEKVFGYTLEEAAGRDLAEMFHRGEEFEEQVRSFVSGPSKTWHDFKNVLRDGREIDTTWANVLLSDGTCVAIGQDISERKRSEQWIRQQAALLNEVPDAIMVKDLEEVIVFWSQGAERMYEWTAGQAQGRKAHELFRTGEEHWREIRDQVLLSGQWSGELHKATESGKLLVMQSRWKVVRDGQGHPKSILTIETDITEKKKLESSFLRAQRMESIGTLAGGIAHDLNNVLAPIMLAIAIIRERVTDEDGLSMLDILQGSAERGANLVKQVLSFARGLDGSRLNVNPNHIVADIEKIIKDTFPKNIECHLRSCAGLWTVTGDPTQLHQVLLNLCVNARDAMPNGGRLRIELENMEVDETYAAMNPEAKAGLFAVWKVSDCGMGIPRAIQEKIFEPFFTTKDIGKGTGLGLSTVMAIVRSHGGFVTVYSEEGKGSTFSVFIPANRQAQTFAAEPPRNMLLPAGRNELVLVVDDESSIRLIAQRTLERYGYRVMLASNGAEAVSLYALHKHEIAAVLTDMAMPIMDGPSAILALRAIDPRVKVIGSSGLTASSELARNANVDLKYFVSKPYTAEALLTSLQAALADVSV